jgi:predicted P-loop ATPase
LSIRPNSAAAVEFLQRAARMWALTCISPDRKGIETRTFTAATAADCLAWLDKWNEIRNVYWHPNPPRHELSKKAEKSDIAAVEWFFVDCDPRAGENLAEEQARLRALPDNMPAGLPRPTLAIFSGGGVQLFFKLREPIVLDSTDAACDEAERYNRWIASQIDGGDSCHSVDHLYRLPFTTNIPDAKKRAKGRVEALAEVLHFDETVHELWAFKQAPPVTKGPVVTASVNARPVAIASLDALDEWRVEQRVKQLITLGHDPERPKASRSEHLFDAVCQLARAGVPDAVTLGLLLDPAHGISASVLDQKRGAEKYARRQIERAKEAADDFTKNEKGVVVASQANIRRALAKLGVEVGRNEFTDRLVVSGLGLGPDLTDAEMTRLYLEIDAHPDFGFRAAKEFFWMVVEDEARRHGFHPVRDYLDAQLWDGTPRIDQWLARYGEADDTPYVRAIGSIVLIAAVRRIRHPGCKFDEMVVLESPQGQLKSTALATLAVDAAWFSDDLPLNADTKIVIERLAGHWIVEAAELKGMRRGDVEHLKSFLSRQTDRARLAYGRLPTIVPRQCVIVGTTNSDAYLRDSTGNRRFWPVRVGRFDIAALARDRDQLWAEAAHREAANESIRLDPSLWPAAGDQQEERRVEDPFVEMLAARLQGMVGKLRAAEVWEIVGVLPGQRTQDHNARLGEAMRALGWRRTKLRFGGGPEWCYVRGTKDEQQRQLVLAEAAHA